MQTESLVNHDDSTDWDPPKEKFRLLYTVAETASRPSYSSALSIVVGTLFDIGWTLTLE